MEVLHFEELTLGATWTTRGRTLTESDLVNHAALSGDWNPLHVDQEVAVGGHFGSRVAHGSLLIAIAMGLGSMDVPQAATVGLVGTGWRFMRPVRAGDTIRAYYRLSRKRDVDEPRWGLVGWRIEITNQRQEIVAEGEATVLVARRDVPPVPVTSPAAKRRRRGRRGSQSPVPVIANPGPPPVEANLPEPAPQDVPPARSRRAATPRVPVAPAAADPPVPAPSEETPPPVSPSARRRRRRRGSGGGATAAPGNEPVPAASPREGVLPVPPTAEHRVYTPGAELAAADVVTSPGGSPTDAGADANPLGQILKRFRRPTNPADGS